MAVETNKEKSMIAYRWQRRIERAQELRNRYPYAREILGFYIQVAGFQNELYGSLPELLSTEPLNQCPPLENSEVWDLTSRFVTFLGMAGEHGPETLRNMSRELQSQGSQFCSELLRQAWQNFSASSAAELLATAFLQPCAEFLLSKARKPASWPNPGSRSCDLSATVQRARSGVRSVSTSGSFGAFCAPGVVSRRSKNYRYSLQATTFGWNVAIVAGPTSRRSI